VRLAGSRLRAGARERSRRRAVTEQRGCRPASSLVRQRSAMQPNSLWCLGRSSLSARLCFTFYGALLNMILTDGQSRRLSDCRKTVEECVGVKLRALVDIQWVFRAVKRREPTLV